MDGALSADRSSRSRPRGWARYPRSLGIPTDSATWLADRFRTLRTDPRWSNLRRVLLLGLVVRLALAPITSLSGDTTSFALADLAFVHNGSPFADGILFEPPLASFLSAPLVGLLLLISPSSAGVSFHPLLLPASSVLGPSFVSPWLPSPGLLLAVKLPLIAADVAATLGLVLLTQKAGLEPYATRIAAAYFLNPLVIWVSSVHGEPDGLAAACVVLFAVALLWNQAFLSGVFLALGIFTKTYPLVLVPLGGVFWTFLRRGDSEPRSRPALQLLGFLAGLAAVALIFSPFFASQGQVPGVQTPSGDFGGLTILSMYNVQMAPLFGLTHAWQRWIPAGSALFVLEVVTFVAVVTGLVRLAVVLRRRPATPERRIAVVTIEAILAGVAGVLLAYPTPQGENVLAVVPFAALALPYWPRIMPLLYAGLSGAAFAFYMALFTPVGAFVPVAVWTGPGGIAEYTRVLVWYQHGGLLWPPPYFWFGFGLVGGIALLAICARAIWDPVVATIRRGVKRGRPRSEPGA